MNVYTKNNLKIEFVFTGLEDEINHKNIERIIKSAMRKGLRDGSFDYYDPNDGCFGIEWDYYMLTVFVKIS